MSPTMVIWVAAGGAMGAALRFVVMSKVSVLVGSGAIFPWATLSVNLLGSFCLGILIEIMALVWSPSAEVRGFLVIGVLGAFTTFSTFSMDLYHLLQRDHLSQAAFYAVGSVLLCLAGFWLGMRLVRLGVG